MDIEKFKESPIGDLVHIDGEDALGRTYDHYAYVPHPLPAKIALRDETWRVLADAVYELGLLGGEGNRLPNPRLLARPIIRAEAVSSSALEGTHTTLPQVFQSELFQDSPSQEVTEVLDQIRAFEVGVNLMQEGQPLGINLIKRMHGILMQNDVRCPAGDKGEFRRRQNFIGPHPRSPIEESDFVPPPHGQVSAAVQAWETWMHTESVAHVLVRAAVSHYQFETIHPFIDGNGRLGRLIVLLLLLHDGRALSQPLLSVSPYLEARRTEYQDHLRQVSITGDFDPWVCFFLEGIKQQARAALEKIGVLRTLSQEMVDTLRTKGVRGTAIRLAEDSIGFPLVTTPDVRDRYEITYQGAAQAIAVMVDHGFLRPITIRANRKLFVCEPVMEAVQAF